VELSRHFRVAAAVVLNKHDLNPEMSLEVEAYCHKEGLPLAGRLPHSPKVVEAMLAGLSISEFDPQGLGDELGRIWSQVDQLTGQARAA
jgi:MinD superfamily P-loop ATPase